MAARTRHTFARALPLLVSVMTGCLLISPLDEFEDEAPNASGGESGQRGGNSAKGGNSGEGGKGSPGGSTDGGGGEAGDPAGTGGTSGSGGTGGCTTNSECVERLGLDPVADPVRCRPSDGTCVLLETDECFLALGDSSDDDAVFLGAFARLNNPLIPEESETVFPLRLAIDEFNQPSDDRSLGLGGRSLVVTICDNENELAIDAAMEHLVNGIEVPAVLATLKPVDLMRVFDAHDDVLYLSPVGRTSALTALDDERDPETRSIWNLLGLPDDYREPYGELMGLVEQYVRYQTGRTPETDLKLALVVNQDDPQTADLGQVLQSALRFNNASTQENGANFGVFPLDGESETSIKNVVDALFTFVPDIIVSAAGPAFSMEKGILLELDESWVSAQRPFYVISPYDTPDFLGAVRARVQTFLTAGAPTDLNRRVLAVSVAPPTNLDLQVAYEQRLFDHFRDTETRPNPDTGNYYDALYYLAYAAYGADLRQPLTGQRMVQGLTRLVDAEKPSDFSVGPSHIDPILGLLDEEETLALETTLGPPDFVDGHRRVNASVSCVEVFDRLTYERRDVLVYDREDEVFGQPSEWPAFPCFPDFFE